GLLRLDPGRISRWQQLLGGRLLDYPQIKADQLDGALLIGQTQRAVADLAQHNVASARFLLSQWKLPTIKEILLEQR
ncbi:MAG: hypothetical protein GY698_15635, partial [Actinomycetia bacterium]|nr:hypothetical protein [Actinomycetes bacterium]